MSRVFFDELGIPLPAHQLSGASGTHGVSTGRIMAQLDPILEDVNPDIVLVYGDTNSTIAAALSAVKLGIPVAHVEAGMRSGNMSMPEEINRIVTDKISALNLAPSELAMTNLGREGLGATSHLVGDIMFDAVKLFARRSNLSDKTSELLSEFSTNSAFVLATFHRQENTDSSENLREIVSGIVKLASEVPVILPMHPRLRKTVSDLGLLNDALPGLILLPPVSYLEMLHFQKHAQAVVTDSGGIQKEAFYLETPCATIRNETEWPETVELGWNRLVEASSAEIFAATIEAMQTKGVEGAPYGKGDSATKIIHRLLGEDWRSYFTAHQG
jgi:UDP-GlcNAc3NAcA epimerase